MEIIHAARPGGEMAAFEALEAQLASCDDLPRLRQDRDRLEALRDFYGKREDSQREMNLCAVAKIYHERRIGQILARTVRKGRTKAWVEANDQRSQDATSTFLPEGLSKSESSRTQAIAAIEHEEFVRHIRLAVRENSELTSRELYLIGLRQKRQADQRKRRRERAEAAANGRAGMPLEGAWEVRQGDVIDRLGEIDRETVRLVMADPPYNIGIDYGEHHDDSLPAEEYLDWSAQWIEAAWDVIAPDGSLWIVINHEYARHVCSLAEEMGFGLRQWLTWYETFGVNCTGMFNRCSRAILWLVKDQAHFVFNEDAPEIRRRSARLERDDARANPEGKIWDDVWGVHPQVPRLCSNFPERQPEFPTQLPLALIRPIVACASTPGDLVVDPFCGSGTTGCICLESARRFVGIELSEQYATLARERIQGHERKSAESVDLQPRS
jgi:site-specific DNA-methyltransferase (adenine-specific)